MERTIKVTGTGKISVKPDITIVSLDFYDIAKSYETALKASTNGVNFVKEVLEKTGICRDTLKTTMFNVNSYYQSYKDKDGEYKSRFAGYKYSQTLKFEFDIDNKKLGKVLYHLSKLPISSNFRISYGIKNLEEAKNELLSKAIFDAKKKAEIISKAAGVTLDEIIDINYSWVDVDYRSVQYDVCEERMKMNKYMNSNEEYEIDIEPEYIQKSDNVTLVYRIK